MLSNRLTTRGAGWIVALATLLLMAATGPGLAIVWDEGYTLGRQARLRLWFRALADPPGFAEHWRPPVEELVQQVGAPPPRADQLDTRAKLLLDPRVLAWFWPFAREEPHGHPPFYALVGLAGDLLTPWRPALARARLGPMIAFSLAAGALFSFVARRWGVWAGAVAAGAWVFQPNLFGHGHYATYDALLAALWLGAVLAFALAVEDDPEVAATRDRPRWRWVVVFGLLLGAAADTKLTGWFLPVPFAAWAVLYRSRRGWWTLLAGGTVAGVALYLLNPPWWTEPVAGPFRFLASNLGRGETIRIRTLFLGQVVSTPDGSLPWYNTLVWTALVTPVGFLSLALVGVGRGLRRWRTEPFGLLAAGHWAFLLLLRALPHTPGHDGVRQFLPAFGMLALLAGPGTASAIARLGRAGRGLGAAALVEGALGLVLMWPVPLSYYSPLVGGLPGAAALGMEPTYYWDALDDDTLAWLRAHTPPGRKVRFATYPTSWLYLRDEGRLPRGLLPGEPGVWTWYVVQNRPGAFGPLDRALIARGRPARVVRKLGVPLLWVFPFDQVEALMGAGPVGLDLDQDGRMKRPTAPPLAAARTVGLDWRLLRTAGGAGLTGPTHSLARRKDLGRRGRLGRRVHGLGRRVDDRGALTANRRRRRAGGPLVAEAQLQLRPGVAATGLVTQQAALRGRRAGRLDDANRRRRARRRNHLADRGRRRARVRAALLVAGAGVARHQHAQGAHERQSQQVSTHDLVSGSRVSTDKTHEIHRLANLGKMRPFRRTRVTFPRTDARTFRGFRTVRGIGG